MLFSDILKMENNLDLLCKQLNLLENRINEQLIKQKEIINEKKAQKGKKKKIIVF